MNPYNEKLTPAMRDFISKQAVSPPKKSTGVIKEALLQEFDVGSDFVSERRIATLCRE